MNFHHIHHLFTIRTEDRRIPCSVAESSQDCCLARVSSPDHEDTELSKICFQFLNLLISELGFRWSRHWHSDKSSCRMIRLKTISPRYTDCDCHQYDLLLFVTRTWIIIQFQSYLPLNKSHWTVENVGGWWSKKSKLISSIGKLRVNSREDESHAGISSGLCLFS